MKIEDAEFEVLPPKNVTETKTHMIMHLKIDEVATICLLGKEPGRLK